MKQLFSILLLIITQSIFSQTDYLNEGNKLLNQNKNTEAETVFREAVKSDSANLIYKCQLALSLMNQKKHVEAEKEIVAVLAKDSLNIGALWYGGINNFLNENPDFRKAINYFEKAFPYINQNSGQYFAVNFFIGKCYKNLLYSDGITFEETNRMLETLKTYVKLQPNAKDTDDLTKFIAKVEAKRPGSNVKKWMLTNNEDKALEQIKKQLDEK